MYAGMCAALFLAVAMSVTASAAQGSAKVQAILDGAAQYTTDGVNWNPLEVGMVLTEGATVKTDTMGKVDLYLGKNGPLVRMQPATTLALSKLLLDRGAGEAVAQTELGVTTGRIQSVVRKLNKSSSYAVKTPVSTCGVRGTAHEVSATGLTIVDSGVVDVTYTPPGATAPLTFEVRGGNTFDPGLNNGQGGVIPTPTNVGEQLRQELRDLRSFMSEQERPTVWQPSPSWMTPPRPFDPPGSEEGRPWNLPPVYIPTTTVEPPGAIED